VQSAGAVSRQGETKAAARGENWLRSLSSRGDSMSVHVRRTFLESRPADDSSRLIADVQMPGLTGLDLQQRLIDEGKRVPIIL
jgi:FixJ family two-component response regulator